MDIIEILKIVYVEMEMLLWNNIIKFYPDRIISTWLVLGTILKIVDLGKTRSKLQVTSQSRLTSWTKIAITLIILRISMYNLAYGFSKVRTVALFNVFNLWNK